MKLHCNLPMTKEEASRLHAGQSVLLSGVVYTARDAAHKRLVELLEQGKPLPFPIENAAVYYVGPSPALDGMALGSAGPTTSSRCDKYTIPLLSAGMTVMIGKGKRNEEVKRKIRSCGAVYLAATGGAGAMLSRCIKRSEIVAFEDLGTEAVRKLYVENFPAVVINDGYGADYYEMAQTAYLRSIE